MKSLIPEINRAALLEHGQRPYSGPVPGLGEVFSSAMDSSAIRTDSFNLQERRYRHRIEEWAEMAWGGGEFDMRRTLDLAQARQYRARTPAVSGTDGGDAAEIEGPLFEFIRERAEAGDERFLELPQSPEEARAEVEAEILAELHESEETLGRRAGGFVGGLTEFAGAAVGGLSTPDLALLPFGAGGTMALSRRILLEVALGITAETAILPDQYRVAEQFDLEKPNPFAQIAMAGAFAGGLPIAARIGGWSIRHGAEITNRQLARMARSKKASELSPIERGALDEVERDLGTEDLRPEGVDRSDFNAAIRQAEVDLREGREPAPAATPSPVYRPDRSLPAEQDPAVMNIARMIGGLEAPQGFNQVYSGSMLHPPRPLTMMSVDEVLDWQARSVAAGSESSAAGRFQIIRETLAGLRDEMGLTGSEIFDEAMQTRMAIHLMRRRGLDDWRAGRISTDQFMDNMAQEWAGLPRATGPNAGRSHYAGDGLNRSLIDLEDARAVFGGRHFDGPPPRGAGAGTRAARDMGWVDEVSTPSGTSVDVRYRVVDLSEVHRATGEYQPRDRSRVASDEQIAEIARDLNAHRLMPSPESTSGAPIIGPDMMVESGNGRVAALIRAAEQHPDRYQAYVRAIIDAGFEIPEGTARPVLVAERLTEMSPAERRQFVRESNTSSIARMSATEQARVDADYLTQPAFDSFQFGRGINSPENAEFVRRVFAGMPQAERAGLMTADGRLNIDGSNRLRQALFARAFDADDLLKLLAETGHPAVMNMLRMLEDLAPDWAAFRAMIEAGYIRPEFDITAQLMDAVRLITHARIEPRDGQSTIGVIRDRLMQDDMFSARDPDLADALIGVFYKGDAARSPTASGAILTRYMHEAESVGRADMDSLLGADARVTPAEVLREAAGAQDARAPMPELPESPDAAGGPATGQADIRALDGMNSVDGAHSPALARATDTALREMRAATEATPERAAAREIAGGPEEAELAAAIAAGRDALETNPDLTLRMGEGPDAATIRLADIFEDLDRDEALMRALTSCNLKGSPR